MLNWVLSVAKRMLWKARYEILYDKKRITSGLIKIRIIQQMKLKLATDKKFFTNIQFVKLYEGTENTMWNINGNKFETLDTG